MSYSIKDLESFLYSANANGYAGGGNEFTPPQRPKFDEVEYKEGDFLFHDSYAGHYFAPSLFLSLRTKCGNLLRAIISKLAISSHSPSIYVQTIVFLKKALLKMDPAKPFRGPESFTDSNWKYISTVTGDTKDFIGNEKIYRTDKLVFEQNFIGGIIV